MNNTLWGPKAAPNQKMALNKMFESVTNIIEFFNFGPAMIIYLVQGCNQKRCSTWFTKNRLKIFVRDEHSSLFRVRV